MPLRPATTGLAEGPVVLSRRGILRVRVRHADSAVLTVLDDDNLVSCAGSVPVLALARRCGLHEPAQGRVRPPGSPGASAGAKVTGPVAGMVAGADCIDDLDLLRHIGMDRVFTDVRAPSTCGTFQRAFSFEHVRQLDAVAARFLPRLTAAAPLLPEVGEIAYADLDDSVRRTFGYAEQGAGYGYSGVKGLNVPLATLSTPLAAPVIAATRLRKGSRPRCAGRASCRPMASPSRKPQAPVERTGTVW